MADFLINMALAVIFGVLKEVIKNPKKKAALRSAMEKLRDVLNAAYPPAE